MAPRISIIIAAHNAEAYLWETLASLQRQRFDGLETIIIDDGSTDRTSFIADRPQCRVVSLPRSGVSLARNTGLALARAPTVLFLDSDDLLAPDALHSLWQGLALYPDAIGIVGQHLKFWSDGEEDPSMPSLRGAAMPSGDVLRFLLQRNFIVNGGSFLIRTEAARKAGGFDSKLRLGEDWDFWCRLALQGSFSFLRTKIVLHYRQRNDGAQNRLRGNPLQLNDEAVASIFSHPEIRARLSWYDIWTTQRLARQDIYWSEARAHMMRRNWLLFSAYIALGAIRYPETLLRYEQLKRYFRGAENALKALRQARP
jgi:glycosyltransferase involved in cell wall biosynthesis